MEEATQDIRHQKCRAVLSEEPLMLREGRVGDCFVLANVIRVYCWDAPAFRVDADA